MRVWGVGTFDDENDDDDDDEEEEAFEGSFLTSAALGNTVLAGAAFDGGELMEAGGALTGTFAALAASRSFRI